MSRHSSIAELNKRSLIVDDFQSTSTVMLCKTALHMLRTVRLSNAAIHFQNHLEKDPEKRYVNYMRYVSLVLEIIPARPDHERNAEYTMLRNGVYASVDTLEVLKVELSAAHRKWIAQEELSVKAIETKTSCKEMDSVKLLNCISPGPLSEPILTVTASALHDILSSSAFTKIVFDVRPKEEYINGHIKWNNFNAADGTQGIINLEPATLSNALVLNHMTIFKSLTSFGHDSQQALKLFEQTAKCDFVFFLDNNSSDPSSIMTLLNSYLIFTRAECSRKAYFLVGGFVAWEQHVAKINRNDSIEVGNGHGTGQSPTKRKPSPTLPITTRNLESESFVLGPRKSVSKKDFSPTESMFDTVHGFNFMASRTIESAMITYPSLPISSNYTSTQSASINHSQQRGAYSAYPRDSGNSYPAQSITTAQIPRMQTPPINGFGQYNHQFPVPPPKVHSNPHSRSTSQNSQQRISLQHQVSSPSIDQRELPSPSPRNSSLINIPPKPFPRTPSIPSIAMTQTAIPPPPPAYNSIPRNNTSVATSVIGNYGMVGLKNTGNTCYMNSVIQCLNATTPLSRFFSTDNYKRQVNTKNKLGSGGAVVDAYATLTKAIWKYADPVLTPRKFKVCGSANRQFKGSDQQDSQEFLAFLLDMLHEDMNVARGDQTQSEDDNDRIPEHVAAARSWVNYTNKNWSIVVDMFQGQLKSQLRCLTCKTASTTYNPFMFLSLPIPETSSPLQIEHCLNKYLEIEVLDGDERWHCPCCKQPRRSTKQLTIHKLPQCLLIHFKRFYYQGPFRNKIESFVNYPANGMDLSPYVPHLNNGMRTGGSVYDLYAVSNHFGTLSGGHYTATVKNLYENQWYHMDDSRISNLGPVLEKTNAAYILFYSRRPVVGEFGMANWSSS